MVRSTIPLREMTIHTPKGDVILRLMESGLEYEVPSSISTDSLSKFKFKYRLEIEKFLNPENLQP